MLSELKNFNHEAVALDEALALSAFAKHLRTEYETRSIEVPEWLDNRQRDLNRFITLRTQDVLEKRRREVLQQLAGMETTSEKRARLERERDELDKLVGSAK